MEKTISMKEILTFIDNAIKNQYELEVGISNDVYDGHITIVDKYNKDNIIGIRNNEDKQIRISRKSNDYVLNTICIEVTNEEILLFKLALIKAKEYVNNSVINYFNKFFEYNDKKINIDDLDNDDDN